MIFKKYETVEVMAKALKDCEELLRCPNYKKLHEEYDSLTTKSEDDLTKCQEEYIKNFEDLVELNENTEYVFSHFDGSLSNMALHLLGLSAFFYRYWIETFDEKLSYPHL